MRKKYHQKNSTSSYEAIESTIPSKEKDKTVIVAPQFLTAADVNKFHLAKNTIYWSLEGWNSDHNSLNLSAHVSSFAILTNFLNTFMAQNKYPNLEEIDIVGFSAGAQFV